MDYFKKIAFGVLNIAKSEFLKMTPREIILAAKGHGEMEAERTKMMMYMAREISYQVYLSQPRRGGHKSIERFWPIGKEKDDRPTKEERQQHYKKLKWLK